MSMRLTRNRIIANVRTNNSHKDAQGQIGLMAIATGLSIIDLCKYLIEEEGPSEAVEKVLASMKRFYGVK